MFSLPNKEKFGEIVQPDLEKYHGRLVLYGAGKVAEVVDYILRQRGIKYLCFCDTYRAGGTHCDHPIISPEELEKDYPGVPVLVTTIHYRNVVDFLEKLSFREILDCVSLLTKADFSNWGKGGERMTAEWAMRLSSSYLIAMHALSSPFSFESLCIYITQKCNLNCLDCSALIPYFQKKTHYDADVTIESAKNLLGYAGIQFRDIYLLGGEPFLHPHLKRMLESVLLISKKERVSIITNGTLLPDSGMIALMQDSRFFLRISDYGDLSVKKEELINLCEQNSILYEVTNYSEWYANRSILTDPCSEEDASTKYELCTDAKCVVLSEQRAFTCCKAMQLCQLGIFNATDENSVDCYTPEGLQERMHKGLQYLIQCDHLDICHRCYGFPHMHPEHMVPPAIQAAGPLHLT